MKAFDLVKALAGEKVITRDGRVIEQLHVFDCESTQTLFGVMEGSVEKWNCLGEYHVGISKHQSNLFMAPKKLSGFVNIFTDRDSSSHKSLDRANQFARKSGMNRIACIDLSQFEEGHGL